MDDVEKLNNCSSITKQMSAMLYIDRTRSCSKLSLENSDHSETSREGVAICWS
jgi:hypothetical protein